MNIRVRCSECFWDLWENDLITVTFKKNKKKKAAINSKPAPDLNTYTHIRKLLLQHTQNQKCQQYHIN